MQKKFHIDSLSCSIRTGADREDQPPQCISNWGYDLVENCEINLQLQPAFFFFKKEVIHDRVEQIRR